MSEETPLRESNPPSEMHARHLLIAAMAAALCLASAATAQNDMSFNDLPKTEDLMTEIFGVLGGSLQEQHDVSEDEVKRHLMRLSKRPSFSVGSLLSGAAGSLAAVNYTQVYENFNAQYCTPASASGRPSPPSISVADVLYTTTDYTGPTLGIQITMGACTDAGNKTFVCQRPQLAIIKSTASITKSGPSVGASKPGASFTDKNCAWSESKTIGHGESADLYNGGSESYDYSGYRAAMYGRAASAGAHTAGKMQARGARMQARMAPITNFAATRVQKAQARMAGIGQGLQNIAGRVGQIPRLGNLFKRRGMETEQEFDIRNLDSKTMARLEEVLPGFFD